MSVQADEIRQWISKGDQKVEKAMIIAKDVREFVTRKMNITVDYNDIFDK